MLGPLRLGMQRRIQQGPRLCLQAEKKMLEANYNKEYLPIEGLAEFRKATIDLMLGPNSKAQQEVRG